MTLCLGAMLALAIAAQPTSVTINVVDDSTPPKSIADFYIDIVHPDGTKIVTNERCEKGSFVVSLPEGLTTVRVVVRADGGYDPQREDLTVAAKMTFVLVTPIRLNTMQSGVVIETRGRSQVATFGSRVFTRQWLKDSPIGSNDPPDRYLREYTDWREVHSIAVPFASAYVPTLGRLETTNSYYTMPPIVVGSPVYNFTPSFVPARSNCTCAPW